MAVRTMAWMTGLALIGSAVCAKAMADGPLLGLYNPLGVYVGAGLGRSSLNQTTYDQYESDFHHLDGQPLGWDAVVGLRPIPILGAEVEYIDFGTARVGPSYLFGSQGQAFLGGDSHDRAAAVFAVGYVPLPIPWVEPFVKLGWAQMWVHDSYSGIYNNVYVDGAVLGQASATQNTHPSGSAYGGGVQFHFEQFAVRAQYERISGEHVYGGWNNPDLLSVGLSWTF